MKGSKNRWLIAASAVGIHISIGSVYAYSAWKMPMENTFGWSAVQTTSAFSIAIFFLGISAAFLGRVIERKGPRTGGLLSAVFFSLGLAGAGLACQLQSLGLFYLCYGVIGGIGLGLGYIAPISTLVKWFPDRRGLATGLAIMGFGFGGLVCTLMIDQFVPKTGEMEVPLSATHAEILSPTTVSQVPPQVETHRVVLYEAKDIQNAFYKLGIIYFLIMLPGALYIAPPPEGYEAHFVQRTGKKIQPVHRELSAAQALRTPGFYGLWLMLFLNVSCGIAVIANAKKMGYEMVHLSVELASVLVMGISLFNGIGRLFWASLSDRLGRANTFTAFFVIQLIAFPLLANLGNYPFAFMGVTFLILTCYGGGFSCIPAYISDLFGLKELPTIQGLLLTAWSLAGIAGPLLNSTVVARTQSYQQSLYIFGAVFAIALIISLLMKRELKRVQTPG
ncbi:MAG: OFA family MFS transporter [Kiritimatiellia bacterium]